MAHSWLKHMRSRSGPRNRFNGGFHRYRRESPTIMKTLDGTPIRKLFIGNLSPQDTDCNVMAIFDAFGDVVECKVIKGKMHPHTNKHNIFAFVTFMNPEDATAALNAKGKYKFPKKWVIKAADSWHQPVNKQDKSESSGSDESEDISISETKEECFESGFDASSAISMLNDDCLLVIFSYFSLPQQLELFKVCRRWNRLLCSLWLRIKELNFTVPPLSNEDFNYAVLTDYLSLCPNVTYLDLSKQPFKVNVLLAIVNNCSKLTKLNICGNQLKHRSLALLGHHFPNLVSFGFTIPEDVFPSETNFDYEILQFIKKSRSLEELTIRYNGMSSEDGMWLSYIKPPLRSLSIDGLPFEFEYFQRGISNAKTTLKELTLSCCTAVSGNHIKVIVKELPEITRLSLISMNCGSQSELLPLASLKHLTHLSLEMNNISDRLVESLAESCRELVTLELIVGLIHIFPGCFFSMRTDRVGITEKAIRYITKLPKLVHLNLSGNPLTDSALQTIANKCPRLSTLSLQSCPISDVGCISVVTQLNSLEFLDVRNCESVTNTTVIAAIEAYRVGNKKKIMIAAGHTDIDFSLNWENPGVKVDDCTSLSGSISSIIGFEGMILLRGHLDHFGPQEIILDGNGMFDDFEFNGVAPWFYSEFSSGDEDDYFELSSIGSNDYQCGGYDFTW